MTDKATRAPKARNPETPPRERSIAEELTLAQQAREAEQEAASDLADDDYDSREPVVPQARHVETRESESRKFDYRAYDAPAQGWNAPRQLDAPEPREGYSQKWIREVMLGKDDPQNATNRLREGWRPRPADSIPAGWPVENGVLRQGGLILMEMPNSFVEQRRAHYASQQKQTDDGLVAEVERVQHPSHPIHQERKQRATMGQVPVQQD